MSTLYDKLEVSNKASKEVIEKAYKVLAKRYHPDLQPQEEKQKAEEKMKEINEAYEVLIDEGKRAEYDQELERQKRQQELEKQQEMREKQTSYYQTEKPKTGQGINQQVVNNTHNNQQAQTSRPYTKEEYEQARKMQKKAQKQYVRDYYKKLRKIKAQLTIKKIRDFCITILIMIGIISFLWFFPPTHRMLVNFYEDNVILQNIVGIFTKGFENIKNSGK